MSIDALRWAFQQQTGSPSKKLVLISMADRADETGCCYPAVSRLSADTELDRKTVLKALAGLRKSGLIGDTGERKGPTKSVIVYRLIGIPNRHENNSEAVPKTVQLSSPKNGTAKAISSPKSGTGSSPKSGTGKQSQKRDTEPTSIEPTIEPLPPIPPKGGSACQKASSRFSEFWDSYPVGFRVDQVGCQRKWKAKKLDGIADDILADIEARKVADGNWLRGFIPRTTTYINQARWNSDLAPTQAETEKRTAADIAAAGFLEMTNGTGKRHD